MHIYYIFFLFFMSLIIVLVIGAIPLVWSGLDILLSAGSSYLVLGRMGRTQSRGWPLKYP